MGPDYSHMLTREGRDGQARKLRRPPLPTYLPLLTALVTKKSIGIHMCPNHPAGAERRWPMRECCAAAALREPLPAERLRVLRSAAAQAARGVPTCAEILRSARRGCCLAPKMSASPLGVRRNPLLLVGHVLKVIGRVSGCNFGVSPGVSTLYELEVWSESGRSSYDAIALAMTLASRRLALHQPGHFPLG